MLKRWSQNKDYELAVEEMMKKFKKYFYPIPMILLIGSVLNPYFKMVQMTQMIKLLHTYMGVSDNDVNVDTIADLKPKINELYIYYYNIVGSNTPPMAQSSTNPTGEANVFNLDRFDFSQEMSSRQSTTRINEYNVYYSQALIIPTGSFNPMLWWKQNSHLYPILSTLACDVLNTPISNVSSESV